MRFTVILSADEEDGGYSAECPAIHGCVSEGETMEEARANIKEAIEGCLDSLAAHHRPIPQEGEVIVTSVDVQVPTEVMARVPVVNWEDAARAFEKTGWQYDRKRGNNYIMVRSEEPGFLSVPKHNPIRRGTLLKLIKEAGMTVDEFVDLL